MGDSQAVKGRSEVSVQGANSGEVGFDGLG